MQNSNATARLELDSTLDSVYYKLDSLDRRNSTATRQLDTQAHAVSLDRPRQLLDKSSTGSTGKASTAPRQRLDSTSTAPRRSLNSSTARAQSRMQRQQAFSSSPLPWIRRKGQKPGTERHTLAHWHTLAHIGCGTTNWHSHTGTLVNVEEQFGQQAQAAIAL
jgi:hypothetical protein